MAETKEGTNLPTVINNHNVDLFKETFCFDPASDLPPGVMSLDTLQVKFENPGDQITGQYLGAAEQQSSYEGQATYLFHEVRTPSDKIIGFIGTKNLDNLLGKIPAEKYDVHIILHSIQKIPPNKTFKRFSVFTRLHAFDIPPTNIEGNESPTPIPDIPF